MEKTENKSERVKQLEDENYWLEQHIDELVLEIGVLKNTIDKMISREKIINWNNKNYDPDCIKNIEKNNWEKVCTACKSRRNINYMIENGEFDNAN